MSRSDGPKGTANSALPHAATGRRRQKANAGAPPRSSKSTLPRHTQAATAGEVAQLRHEVCRLAEHVHYVDARTKPVADRIGERVQHTRRRLARAASRTRTTLVPAVGPTSRTAPGASGAFVATEHGPLLRLRAPAGALPYGWAVLELSLQVRVHGRDSRLPAVQLVLDEGSGLQPGPRIGLRTCDDDGAPIETHIVFLPPGLRGLGLALPGVPSGARIEALQAHVTEITRQEAVLRQAWSQRASWAGSPRQLVHGGQRALHWLRHRGLGATLERIARGAEPHQPAYARWVAEHDLLGEADRAAIEAHIDRMPRRPRFSLLMPVYNTPAGLLEETLGAVQAQLYDNWELCIVNDASEAAHIEPLLDAAAAADPRIRVQHRTRNGHICRASNDALALAQGDFAVLLDHDDVMTPHALYMLAAELEAHPDAQVLYSDEDKLSASGERYDPYFKSDLSPELLLGHNMLGHLSAYSMPLMRQLGGFREGFEGSQDWDLALRATEAAGRHRVRHIPHVLYHWRAIAGSTASGHEAKPYTALAGRRAVEEALKRRGLRAEVRDTRDVGYFHIHYALPEPAPLVSILVPTRDRVDLLRQCIDSLLARTDYPALEVLILDNDSAEPETLAYFADVQKDARVRVVPAPGPFNFAAINNLGAAAARGQVLCMLNNDIEIIEPGWLREMVGHAVRPEIGAVGARLLYPDGFTMQHGGVVMGIGGAASHAFHNMDVRVPADFGRDRLARNYAAVTAACLVVRRDAWEAVGGLDVSFAVAYNDVDFCLRLDAHGLANVWTPFATLLHHESASRGSDAAPKHAARFAREQAQLIERWSAVIDNDPNYNPNLSFCATNFSLADAPRAPRPWRRRRSTGARGETSRPGRRSRARSSAED